MFVDSLFVILGFLAAVPLGGVVVGFLMKRFASEIDAARLAGLKNGGRCIGWLERTMILLFILSGYHDGVGFLLGAKSILRFGEIKDQQDRKVTEYIIIGTFSSFAWAMLAAHLLTLAMRTW